TILSADRAFCFPIALQPEAKDLPLSSTLPRIYIGGRGFHRPGDSRQACRDHAAMEETRRDRSFGKGPLGPRARDRDVAIPVCARGSRGRRGEGEAQTPRTPASAPAPARVG